MLWLLSWSCLIVGWLVLWLGHPALGVCLIALFALVQFCGFRHGAAVGTALAGVLVGGAHWLWHRFGEWWSGLPSRADHSWQRQAVTEHELRSMAADKDRFIGMTGAAIEEILGTCTSVGSFDFGLEVWCWNLDSLCVEAWLREGCCEKLDVISKRDLG